MFDLPLSLVSIKGSSEICALVPLIKNLSGGKKKKKKLLHTENYNWVIKREYSFAPHWIKELLIGLFAFPGQWHSLVLTVVRWKLSSEWIMAVSEWPGLPLETACFQKLSCLTRKEIWGEQMATKGKQKDEIPDKQYQQARERTSDYFILPC